MLHLLLHLAFRIIHLLQMEQFFLTLFTNRRMQAVADFHFTANLLRTDGLLVMVYLHTFLIDAYRHDVQVLAVDVLMQPDNIRLVPVTELLHELTGQCRKLFLRKNVFRGRVQRDMDDRFPDVRIECHVRLKRLHAVLYRDVSVLVRCDSGMSENLCGSVIRLDFIVGNHSVEGAAGTDIGDHRATLFS